MLILPGEPGGKALKVFFRRTQGYLLQRTKGIEDPSSIPLFITDTANNLESRPFPDRRESISLPSGQAPKFCKGCNNPVHSKHAGGSTLGSKKPGDLPIEEAQQKFRNGRDAKQRPARLTERWSVKSG